jgi:putative nucleotidyltransferase with HDIG domain
VIRGAAATPLGFAIVPDEVAASLQRAEEAHSRGKWSAAREHFAWALSVLPPRSEPGLAARIMRRIARCHIDDAEFEAALDTLNAARAVGEQDGDRSAVAHAVNLMGVAEGQRGRLAAAESLYVEARTTAEAAGDALAVAMVSQNQGILANIRGDYAAARAHYESSLGVYEGLGRDDQIARLLINLGMLHTDLEDWRAAESAFGQALARSRAMGDLGSALQAQSNRVELYLARRRFRTAKRICRSVLHEAAAGAEHAQWMGETYKHLGVVYRETGELTEAAQYFQRALGEAQRREDQLLEAETLRESAVLHRREGRTQETLMALNRAHELFTALAAKREVIDIARRRQTLEEDFLELVRNWGNSIESKDRYTQGHCERVADVACLLARDAGVGDDVLLWFRMGALLHDVGKVMIPESVLNKPGELSEDEWVVMREHPVVGERLVADAHFPLEVLPMIRHHHERWDGNGYPDRIARESIPYWARILCIADVYDALTTARSYRQAFSPAAALTIMRGDSGRAFDPALLEIFLLKTWPVIEAARAPLPIDAPWTSLGGARGASALPLA